MVSDIAVTDGRHSRLALGALLFHVGFLTLVLQSLLAREFLALFHGAETTLGVFYASWLIWIGIGAVSWRLLPRIRGRIAQLLPLVPVLLPTAGGIALRCLGWAREASGVPASELVPFGTLSAIALAATALIGLPAGLSFAVACHAVETPIDSEDKPRSAVWVGVLFGLEALGGFAGGLLYTLLLRIGIPATYCLALLALLGGAHLLAWTWACRLPMRWALTTLGVVFIVGTIGITPLPPALRQIQRHRFETRHPGYQWVEQHDSRYDRLVVAKRGDQRVLFAGGEPVYLPAPSDARRLAALAMVQATSGARRILIVGHAMPELERAFLAYPSVKHLASVALDPFLNRLIADKLTGLERVKRIAGDPRAHLNLPPGENRYDIILVLAPDPVSARANRLYTVEFYRRVAAHLSGRGVLITGVTASANYLGDAVGDYAGSVVRTVREVFDHTRLVPGDRLTILAGASTASNNAQTLIRRYRPLRGNNRAFAPAGFHTLLPRRDVERVEERLRHIDAPINRDARPASYYLGTLVWARFSGSESLANLLRRTRRIGIWTVLVPLIAFFLARLVHVTLDRRNRRPLELARFNAVASIALLGAVSMAFSLMLLLAYQSSVGYLFGRIALLTSLYMLGLGVGSQTARALRPSPAAARGLLLGALALIAVVLPIAAAIAAHGAPLGGGVVFMLLLFTGGLLAGVAFAFAAIAFEDAAGRTGASLDAADHAGGATGALLTGAVLLPLFGFQAAMWTCALALCGLVLLHLQQMLLESLGPSGKRPAPPDRLRSVGWVLLAIVVSAWFLGTPSKQPASEQASETARETETFPIAASELPPLPEGTEWEKRADPFPHWTAPCRDEGNRRIVVTTDHTAPGVRGYVGPIVLAVELDRLKIRNIALVHMQETPAYVRHLSQWLQRFRNMPANRPLQLGRDIDAMSGATVSSVAIVETINRTLGACAELTSKDPLPTDWETTAPLARLLAPAPVALAIAFLMFVPVYLFGGGWTRRLFLALVAATIGFYLNRQFSILDPASVALGDIPTLSRPAGIVLLIGVALTGLLWGSAYCGYLCPFGALQELVASLTGADHHRPLIAGRLRAARSLRYVVLAISLAGFLFTRGSSRWIDWDILPMVFRSGKSALAWSVLAVLLLTSAILPRAWCLYLCPAGALLSLFNRFALLQRTRLFRKARYGACDLGATAGRPRDCLRCNRCLVLDARPAPISRMRATLGSLAIALAILAIGVLYFEKPVEPEQEPARITEAVPNAPDTTPAPPTPQARSPQSRALDEAVRLGRISGREAMYYAPLSPSPSPARDEQPARRRRRGRQ